MDKGIYSYEDYTKVVAKIRAPKEPEITFAQKLNVEEHECSGKFD